MDLNTLLKSAETDLTQALNQEGQIRTPVTENAQVLVERGADREYTADLRVKGNTVAVVQERDYSRFLQQLKEQIAIHVPRDQQPDLTGA